MEKFIFPLTQSLKSFLSLLYSYSLLNLLTILILYLQISSKIFHYFHCFHLIQKKKKTNQRLEQDSLAVKAAFIKTCNNDKNSGKLNIAEISTVDQAPCWVLETWWWIRHICGTSSYIGVNGGQINQWENEVITDYFKSHEWN